MPGLRGQFAGYHGGFFHRGYSYYVPNMYDVDSYNKAYNPLFARVPATAFGAAAMEGLDLTSPGGVLAHHYAGCAAGFAHGDYAYLVGQNHVVIRVALDEFGAPCVRRS